MCHTFVEDDKRHYTRHETKVMGSKPIELT